MVGAEYGDLKAKVFFIWGALCTCAFVYAYFLVYETKSLSLEQVDRMMEESTPITSSKWRATTTFAAEMGMTEKPGTTHETKPEILPDVPTGTSAV